MSKKESTQKEHQRRMNLLLEYIHNNPHEKLDLSILASICFYSEFHLHRIFQAQMGETLSIYVTRTRLNLAASLLLQTSLSIADIATKVGYASPAVFNRVFKKQFAQTPSEFKISGKQRLLERSLKTEKIDNFRITKQPKIKIIDQLTLVYAFALGQYGDKTTSLAWNKVCKFAKENHLFNFSTKMIGISYDDPELSIDTKCRYEACISIKKEIESEGDIGVKRIAAGRYAIFTHKGSYSTLKHAYDYIYGDWMLNNSITLKSNVSFERYFHKSKKSGKHKTDIYIPIE